MNIQQVKAPSLRASLYNPRNQTKVYNNNRGNIYASDGTLLADSVKSKAASPHEYLRQYPQGSLYSQVVGYSSPFYGTAGIENEYNDQLVEHTMPAQTLSQALGFNPLETSTDNLTLTINPTLQKAAQAALSQVSGANKDAGVVAMDPSTGAILADYSNPTFDPNALANPDIAAEREVGYAYFDQKDAEGIYPGVPLATGDPFPPGSTFKVVTSTAVYNLDPALTNFNFPPAGSTKLPNSNAPHQRRRTGVWRNDGHDAARIMRPGLRASRYRTGCADSLEASGVVRLQLQAPRRSAQGLGGHADISRRSAISPPNQAYLAYSAIGQYNVKASALSNVLVAAGIANGGS